MMNRRTFLFSCSIALFPQLVITHEVDLIEFNVIVIDGVELVTYLNLYDYDPQYREYRIVDSTYCKEIFHIPFSRLNNKRGQYELCFNGLLIYAKHLIITRTSTVSEIEDNKKSKSSKRRKLPGFCRPIMPAGVF